MHPDVLAASDQTKSKWERIYVQKWNCFWHVCLYMIAKFPSENSLSISRLFTEYHLPPAIYKGALLHISLPRTKVPRMEIAASPSNFYRVNHPGIDYLRFAGNKEDVPPIFQSGKFWILYFSPAPAHIRWRLCHFFLRSALLSQRPQNSNLCIGPFIILEPQDRKIGKFYITQDRWAKKCETPKLRKGRSGILWEKPKKTAS